MGCTVWKLLLKILLSKVIFKSALTSRCSLSNTFSRVLSFSIPMISHRRAKPPYQHPRSSEYGSFNRGQKRGFPGVTQPKEKNNPFSSSPKPKLLLLPSFPHFPLSVPLPRPCPRHPALIPRSLAPGLLRVNNRNVTRKLRK